MAFQNRYFEARNAEEYDFVTWKFLSIMNSDSYICSELNDLYKEKLKFMGKFHVTISRFPIPVFAALASRLAEIGIRTTFVVMTSVATLLLEELEQRLEEQAENLATSPFDEQQMSKDLDQWKYQYDLVVRLIEQINRCFSLELLLISQMDFIVSVTDFQNIHKFQYRNLRAYFKFAHGLLRVIVFLAASNCVEFKVLRRFHFSNSSPKNNIKLSF